MLSLKVQYLVVLNLFLTNILYIVFINGQMRLKQQLTCVVATGLFNYTTRSY